LASRTKIMKAVYVVVRRHNRCWPIRCGKGRSADSVCSVCRWRSRLVWRQRWRGPSVSDACPWVHHSCPLLIQWQLGGSCGVRHHRLQPGLTGAQHGMRWGSSLGSPSLYRFLGHLSLYGRWRVRHTVQSSVGDYPPFWTTWPAHQNWYFSSMASMLGISACSNSLQWMLRMEQRQTSGSCGRSPRSLSRREGWREQQPFRGGSSSRALQVFAQSA